MRRDIADTAFLAGIAPCPTEAIVEHEERLARVLGVSKPVVTRALNTLGALGYLRRERDQDDRRNVFVVRTNSGADFLEGFKRNLRDGGDGSAAAHRPIIGQAPAYAHQR